MAWGMAMVDSKNSSLGNARTELDLLRKRNEELGKEVKERREREESMQAELLRTKERLMAAEEAEERLCVQLGELEAEALAQAREYRVKLRALTEQLAQARRLLDSSSAAPPAPPLVA